LNGNPYKSALLKKISGYVMQEDLLNGHLTVEETLQYTAKLRCPPYFTADELKTTAGGEGEWGRPYQQATSLGGFRSR
jgi:ABC-type multidrug transport system ATPase subunit